MDNIEIDWQTDVGVNNRIDRWMDRLINKWSDGWLGKGMGEMKESLVDGWSCPVVVGVFVPRCFTFHWLMSGLDDNVAKGTDQNGLVLIYVLDGVWQFMVVDSL